MGRYKLAKGFVLILIVVLVLYGTSFNTSYNQKYRRQWLAQKEEYGKYTGMFYFLKVDIKWCSLED